MTYQEFLDLIQRKGDLTQEAPVYTCQNLNGYLNDHVTRLAAESRNQQIQLERLNLSQFSAKDAADILFSLKTFEFFRHQTSLSTIIMPKKETRYKGCGLFDSTKDELKIERANDSLEAHLKVIERQKAYKTSRDAQRAELSDLAANGDASIAGAKKNKGRVSYALHRQSSSDLSLVRTIGEAILDTSVTRVEGLEHVKPHSKRFLQMICWYNVLSDKVKKNETLLGPKEFQLYSILGNFLGAYNFETNLRRLETSPDRFKYPELMQYHEIARTYEALGLGKMQSSSYAGDPDRHAIYMNALDQVYNEVERRMAELHPHKAEIDAVNAAMQVSFKP